MYKINLSHSYKLPFSVFRACHFKIVFYVSIFFHLKFGYKKAEFYADSEYDEKKREKNSISSEKWSFFTLFVCAKVFCRELLLSGKNYAFLKTYMQKIVS